MEIVVSLSPIWEERDVEISEVGDEGPRGAPIEGVLVERELHRFVNSGHTQLRVEFTKSSCKPTKVGAIAGGRNIHVPSDVRRAAKFGSQSSDDDITDAVPFEDLEKIAWSIWDEFRHGL